MHSIAAIIRYDECVCARPRGGNREREKNREEEKKKEKKTRRSRFTYIVVG